jgi:hypothetical protein
MDPVFVASPLLSAIPVPPSHPAVRQKKLKRNRAELWMPKVSWVSFPENLSHCFLLFCRQMCQYKKVRFYFKYFKIIAFLDCQNVEKLSVLVGGTIKCLF